MVLLDKYGCCLFLCTDMEVMILVTNVVFYFYVLGQNGRIDAFFFHLCVIMQVTYVKAYICTHMYTLSIDMYTYVYITHVYIHSHTLAFVILCAV